MMLDALRAAQVVPAFRAALVLHLVEISPALQQRQQQALAALDVPVDVASDASTRCRTARPSSSPTNSSTRCRCNQAVKQSDGWHERVVEIDADGNLAFGIAQRPDPAVRAARAARACATRRSARSSNGAPTICRSSSAGGCASGRRGAGHRLRPRRERGRRHLAGGRRPRLRRSAAVARARSTSPPMSISRRSRSPPKAWARACHGPIEQARIPPQPRHREARGRAQGAGLAARRRPRSTARSSGCSAKAAPRWARCSRCSASPIRSSARCRASSPCRRQSRTPCCKRHRCPSFPASATASSPARAACRRASTQASTAASAPSDAPAKVAENRARMAAALGVAPERFLTCYQIHSPDVVVAETPWPASDAAARRRHRDARRRASPSASRTADCGPVLFADRASAA